MNSNLKLGSRFYNQDGSLTRYALACGYLEVARMGEHSRVTLGMEHAHFHIKGRVAGVRVWEVFDTLTPARQLFRKISAMVDKLPVVLKG